MIDTALKRCISLWRDNNVLSACSEKAVDIYHQSMGVCEDTALADSTVNLLTGVNQLKIYKGVGPSLLSPPQKISFVWRFLPSSGLLTRNCATNKAVDPGIAEGLARSLSVRLVTVSRPTGFD